MPISQTIKLVRKRWDLSQTAMGYIFGITKNMIQSYEREKANPPKFFIERLSTMVNYPLEDMGNHNLDYSDINFLPKKIHSAIEIIETLENKNEELDKMEIDQMAESLAGNDIMNLSKEDRLEARREGLQKILLEAEISNIKKLLRGEYKIDIDNSKRIDLFPIFLDEVVPAFGSQPHLENYQSSKNELGNLPYFNMLDPQLLIDIARTNGDFSRIVEDYSTKFFDIPISGLADCDFAIDSFGNDMTPKIKTGDIIICKMIKFDKEWSSILYGEIYLIIYEGGHMISRIKRGKDNDHFLLEGENKDYDPSNIDKKKILGLCLVKAVINRFIL